MKSAVRRRRGLRPGQSPGEAELALQIKVAKLPAPARQYQPALAYGRRWALDFAWPENRLGVEIDGAPHRIKERFLEDQRKRLAWRALDWTVFSFSPKMVKSGLALAWVAKHLGYPSDCVQYYSMYTTMLVKHGVLEEP